MFYLYIFFQEKAINKCKNIQIPVWILHWRTSPTVCPPPIIVIHLLVSDVVPVLFPWWFILHWNICYCHPFTSLGSSSVRSDNLGLGSQVFGYGSAGQLVCIPSRLPSARRPKWLQLLGECSRAKRPSTSDLVTSQESSSLLGWFDSGPLKQLSHEFEVRACETAERKSWGFSDKITMGWQW